MTAANRPTRSARSLAFAAAATALMAGLVPTTDVAAATSCAYVAGSKTVTVNASGAVTAKVSRNAAGAILVDGAACGAATVGNTNNLAVVGDGAAQTVHVLLGNGGFAPGASPEATGASDIEITINLAGGTDKLIFLGGGSADVMRLGAGGADLNDDGDADAGFSAVEKLQLNGEGGADKLYGTGINGGLATTVPLTIYGGPGADDLRGGSEGDTLVGGADADSLRGGDGPDSLDGGLGADALIGGNGTDTATYAARTTSVEISIDGAANDGASGEHDLIATDIENVIGGSGSDALIGSSWTNRLVGGAGNDYLDGMAGGDTLEGGPGADQLVGGADGDTMFGGPGADDHSGGAGVDQVSYADRSAGVTAWIGSGASGEAGENDSIDATVEVLRGGSGNDTLGDSAMLGATANTLFGDAGNDTLYGGGGNDTLYGGTGNDTLVGGIGQNQLLGEGGDDSYRAGDQVQSGTVGADTFVGGPGTDTADYALRSTAVSVNLDNVANDGRPGEADNIKDDVERVTGGSAGDTFTGNGNANRFFGNGGNDTAQGQGGLDILEGGTGNDTLGGNDGNDILSGGPDVDVLNGGAANDTLNGGDGDDKLDGASGDDALNGDAGMDVVTYEAKTGPVFVHLADGLDNEGTAGEADAFDSIEIVKGSNYGDTMMTSPVDWLYRLYGLAGKDYLTGSPGMDSIHGGENADTIMLMGPGVDGTFDYVCSVDNSSDDPGDSVFFGTGGGTIHNDSWDYLFGPWQGGINCPTFTD
jgi:Ca2+-binding RTX toxin-like protein